MTYDPYDSSAAPATVPPTLSVAERRPTGVVIAALTLGLATLAALGSAGIGVMAAVLVHKSPQALAAAQAQAQAQSQVQGTVPPSVAAIMLVYAMMTIIGLGLAVWGGVTIVGLLRLKPWARISIMAQGGIVAVVAGFFTLGCLLAPLMASAMKLPPTVSQSQMRLVFAGMGLVSGLIALVGVWWIVYFALRRTREAFSPGARPAQAVNGRPWGAPPMTSRVQPQQVGPITDFSVAQPLPAEEDKPKTE